MGHFKVTSAAAWIQTFSSESNTHILTAETQRLIPNSVPFYYIMQHIYCLPFNFLILMTNSEFVPILCVLLYLQKKPPNPKKKKKCSSTSHKQSHDALHYKNVKITVVQPWAPMSFKNKLNVSFWKITLCNKTWRDVQKVRQCMALN